MLKTNLIHTTKKWREDFNVQQMFNNGGAVSAGESMLGVRLEPELARRVDLAEGDGPLGLAWPLPLEQRTSTQGACRLRTRCA